MVLNKKGPHPTDADLKLSVAMRKISGCAPYTRECGYQP